MNPDPSQNFQINLIQGATKILVITWYDVNGVPVDLTSYSAADMIWRSTVDDTGTPIIELTNDSGIVFGGVLGTITITVPSATTAVLSNAQTMVYNLFITDSGGIVYPILAGATLVEGSTIR